MSAYLKGQICGQLRAIRRLTILVIDDVGDLSLTKTVDPSLFEKMQDELSDMEVRLIKMIEKVQP